MDSNPFNTEWNNDAAEYEHELARTTCPTCHGTGYVADSHGEAEACDECGDEDAAEAIVPEPGMPF